ncbi:hypothetical protein J6590_073783 [Homalodisca vitripennis]|nr:hypothetical protein J6590_073783 [Homalodisca vitripennis]
MDPGVVIAQKSGAQTTPETLDSDSGSPDIAALFKTQSLGLTVSCTTYEMYDEHTSQRDHDTRRRDAVQYTAGHRTLSEHSRPTSVDSTCTLDKSAVPIISGLRSSDIAANNLVVEIELLYRRDVDSKPQIANQLYQ